MTVKQKLALFTLVILQFTHVLDFVIMMPLSTVFIKEYGISTGQFGLLVSLYGFAAAISGFSSSAFADKFDRKHLLLFLYSGFLIGTFCCAIAPSYLWLCVARVVTGLFGGILSGQTLTITSEIFPVEKRSTVTGIVMSGFALASALGVPFSLYLSHKWGYNYPFFFICLLGLIALAMIFAYIPSVKPKGNSHKNENVLFNILGIASPTSEIEKEHLNNQRRALLMGCLIILGGFPVITMMNPYLRYNIGFSEYDIMIMYIIGGLLTIFSTNIFGYLSDKYNRHVIFRIMSIVAIVPILAITHFTSTSMVLAYVILGVFFIAVNGRMVPAQSLLTSVVEPYKRGGFLGVSAAFQQIALGFAALISGLIVQEDANKTLHYFNFVGYFAVICSLLALYISTKVHSIEIKK
jgi:DHA1 family inner membrane transport protein